MWLSLEFLYHKLKKKNSQLMLNGHRNPSFLGVGLFGSALEPRGDTVYVCPGNISPNAFDGERSDRCSVIWLGSRKPPENISVLWLKDAWDYVQVFNEVLEIFQTFHKWSDLVYDAVTKRKPLQEIFHLLTMVTPNPWYLSDPSFRMLVIKDEPDYCEISPIWRYQYAHGHLPVDVVFRMVSSGELRQMNETTEATFFFNSLAFRNGNNFVSKTIFSPKGVIGHFYIIGMYGTLTSYEKEIAEFFGNVLTDLLQHDPNYMPSTGAFYDYYFIDLLERKVSDEDMIPLVLENLRWSETDTYRVIVVEAQDHDSIAQAINNLQIHLFEEALPSKAFLYHDKLVVLLNESQIRLPSGMSVRERSVDLERQVRRLLTQFDNSAGYSESFQGLAHLEIYYQQAKVALNYALQEEESGILLSYTQISTRHLVSSLYQTLPHRLVCHPAVSALYAYDRENNTELATTLRYYLENEQNTQKTAQKLYIHRNSLMYRMDRIQELVSLDLCDPEERLRLLISYYAPQENPENK